MDDHKRELLKNLPKIDGVMLILEKKGAFSKAPRSILKSSCRSVVGDLRKGIMEAKENAVGMRLPTDDQVADQIVEAIDSLHQYKLRRVVNATGVILHTNLGRAPLCREALERVTDIGAGYSNLEYDIGKGDRGLRYHHVQGLLCELSGADDALVVNNNAAAVLLVLNTLAQGKDVIVSRGELVEIGGEFRIPEVMEKSGARLHEVGTTNRTRLSDYEKAIGPETGLILKVHTSNFKIVGFTEETEIRDLIGLGKKHAIPVMHDLGSGCFVELDHYGLQREPTVSEALDRGVDVITFSGDKLLGGPQAGIILGKQDIVRQIKQNPLNRALRIDKLTLAALEGTIIHYLQPEQAVSRIKTLKMLTEPVTEVKKRARKLLNMLKKDQVTGITLSLKEGFSMAGGGSLPEQGIPTVLIRIVSTQISCAALEERLRHADTPIVTRIVENEVLLDLRTIAEDEYPLIRDGLKQAVVS